MNPVDPQADAFGPGRSSELQQIQSELIVTVNRLIDALRRGEEEEASQLGLSMQPILSRLEDLLKGGGSGQ